MFVAEVKNFKNFSKVYVFMILFKSGRKFKLLHNFEVNLVLKFCVRTAK